MEEKATSLALGGLTSSLRAQFDNISHGRVGRGNRLGVGGVWAEG